MRKGRLLKVSREKAYNFLYVWWLSTSLICLPWRCSVSFPSYGMWARLSEEAHFKWIKYSGSDSMWLCHKRYFSFLLAHTFSLLSGSLILGEASGHVIRAVRLPCGEPPWGGTKASGWQPCEWAILQEQPSDDRTFDKHLTTISGEILSQNCPAKLFPDFQPPEFVK